MALRFPVDLEHDPWAYPPDVVAEYRRHLYGHLALVHVRLDELDDALACATRYAHDFPDDPEALMVAAVVHTFRGQHDTARQLLAHACAVNPPHAAAFEQTLAQAHKTWSIKQPKTSSRPSHA